MWVKNVSKSLKNINSQKNLQPRPMQGMHTQKQEQFRESHIKHQIPNQHLHPQQDQMSYHPNRGGFGNFNQRRGSNPNYGGRGGYQGNNRFDRNENNSHQNFSYGRK